MSLPSASTQWQQHHLIPPERQRQGPGKLSLGEMLFIMVLFHLWPGKDFKHFRSHGVEQEFRHCFAQLPPCRFVALMPRLLLPFPSCSIATVAWPPSSTLSITPSWRSAIMPASAATGCCEDGPTGPYHQGRIMAFKITGGYP